MNRFTKTLLPRCILFCLFVIGFAQVALADGTPSGTSVNNSATLDYSVGGVGQAQIISNTRPSSSITRST